MQVMEPEQYIEFDIEDVQYAIRIQDVHEIIRMQDITQIPYEMPYVKGVINLRGKVVPIISLRSLFQLPEKEYSKTTRIVVVHHREDKVGIIVDRVNKVAVFKNIEPPPDHVGNIDGHLFAGIGLSDSGIVGILKLDEVLVGE